MSVMTQKDANQAIRTAFDETTSGLKTVPSYVDTTVLVNGVSAAANFTSSVINVLPYKVTGLMISWASLNQTDSSVQLQGSVDGTIYESVGSAVALSSASGQHGVSLIDEPYKYIRAVFTHGTNSAGTVTIKYIQRA